MSGAPCHVSGTAYIYPNSAIESPPAEVPIAGPRTALICSVWIFFLVESAGTCGGSGAEDSPKAEKGRGGDGVRRWHERIAAAENDTTHM